MHDVHTAHVMRSQSMTVSLPYSHTPVAIILIVVYVNLFLLLVATARMFNN